MSSTPIHNELQARRRRKELQQAAQSQYGQLRLTVTFERGGRLSYRMMAKRPQDAWRELNVVAQGTALGRQYPPTFDDALLVLAQVAARLSQSEDVELF